MNSNSDQKENKQKRAPNWAMEPFEYFLDQTEYLSQILHLTIRGISGLRGIPKIVEVVAKVSEAGKRPNVHAKVSMCVLH